MKLSNFLGALTTKDIIILSVVAVIFVGILIAGIIKMRKNKKIQAEIESREVEDVTIKKGIRYTDDMTIVTSDGETNLSYGKGDCLLKQNETYVAARNGYVHPGKYTILTTNDDETSFNIRVGVYVREYKHGQEIVLAEGEEITAVSSDVILR